MRSTEFGKSSRSHSADEGNPHKAPVAHRKHYYSTTPPVSGIPSENRLPPSHFPFQEAAWPTLKLFGRRAQRWSDNTHVEDASYREDEEFLFPENVRPDIRYLTREGFLFNPGCPHIRKDYIKWLEANQHKTQPFAIEILAEPPREKHVPLETVTTALGDVPNAIRINSKPILKFLASLNGEEQQWIKRKNSMVISNPFKILVHCESALRNRCNELQRFLDLLNNKLAQTLSRPDQSTSPESAVEEAPRISSSEQGSQSLFETDSDAGSESGLHHRISLSEVNKSTWYDRHAQEVPEKGDEIQSRTFSSSFKDEIIQGGTMKGAKTIAEMDADDVSKKKYPKLPWCWIIFDVSWLLWTSLLSLASKLTEMDFTIQCDS